MSDFFRVRYLLQSRIAHCLVLLFCDRVCTKGPTTWIKSNWKREHAVLKHKPDKKISLQSTNEEISCSWLSCVFGIWTVSLNRPAVISHHIYIQSAQISLFHHFYILVELFTLFVTYVTTSWGNLSKWLNKKWTLMLILQPNFWNAFSIFATWSLQFTDFFLSRKLLMTVINIPHAVLSKRVIDSANCLSFFIFVTWVPSKMPSFSFSALRLWKDSRRYLKHYFLC